MSTPLLRESCEGGVLTLTLARPDKKNALNAELIAGLQAGIDRAQLDADVRVVLVAAEGADFCAGADLAELLESAQRTEAANEASALALGRIFEGFRALPQPVIAAVRGRALAGGMGLVTAADLVVATDDATFGYPEIQRGFVPAMVMTMLRRLVGERVAFELVGTGRVVSALEAQRLGLITRAVPLADFEDDVRRLAGTLASRPATALALTKRLLYELDGKNFHDGIALGARVNAHARTTPEFSAAIAGFLAKSAGRA